MTDAEFEAQILAGTSALRKASPELKHALQLIKAPHVRHRPGGFQGMFRIIVEQQVSVSSAQAILARIDAAIDPANVEAVLQTGLDGLRDLGLSRPKARYVIELAEKLSSGAFSFAALQYLDDEAALVLLTSLKGVGPWSAVIYLLFCEGRFGLWPPKDVALKAAFNHARSALAPDVQPFEQAEFDEFAQRWAPHGGVAAHILWTYYARIKGRTPI